MYRISRRESGYTSDGSSDNVLSNGSKLPGLACQRLNICPDIAPVWSILKMPETSPYIHLPEHHVLFPQGRQLLARHQVTLTQNIGQARYSVENVFFPHRLVPSAGVNAVDFQHRCVKLNDVTLNFITYGTDIEVLVQDLNRHMYVVVIPLEGQSEVRHGCASFAFPPGKYLIIDPRSRFDCYMSRDHCHLALGIPRWRLEATLERQGISSSRLIDFPLDGIEIDEDDRELFGMLAYVCQEIDIPASALEHRMVAVSIEETLLSLFAQRFLKNSVRNGVSTELSQALPYYVRRAEKFMLANLTENLSAEDVAKAAGVPLRTLYHGFHQYRGQPPLVWLKMQRLRQARRDILQSGTFTLTVTELANRYCASSVSRFANAYREAFGELPSETLRRLQVPQRQE
jgi:AraC-like DNA-binding protein